MIDIKIIIIASLIVSFFAMAVFAAPRYEKAILAGGCFWCMEHPFDQLNGVKDVIAGYTGGTLKNPGYHDHAVGGHVEAVQITFDPSVISYREILDVYWREINPTDSRGQFCDKGPSYRTAVFYMNSEQKKIAEQSKASLEKSGRFDRAIVTEIRKASTFYPAEDYHQNFYIKNPLRYNSYRDACGRDEFKEKVWGKDSDVKKGTSGKIYKKYSIEELKKMLTPLQFKVTQKGGTEEPFKNEYWDNKSEGIYVDVVSGEVLFSSKDKFDSGTGWPSFTRPLVPDNIKTKTFHNFFMNSTEVRSKNGDSHLGHLFSDGPEPTGLRYCINSASLRFIPVEDLEKEGYGEYKRLFGE